MFVNCPSCRGLVATDPATDEPPERCPRCASRLRGTVVAPTPADDARSGVAAAIAEHVGALDAATADPAGDRNAQPSLSIANLLQPEPVRVESGGYAVDGMDGGTRVDDGTPSDAVADRTPPVDVVADGTPLDVAAAGTPMDAAADEPTADASAESLPPDSPVDAPPPTIADGVAADASAPLAVAADVDAVRADEPDPLPTARSRRGDRRATPSFVRRAGGGAPRPARRWPMVAAIAALSLLLGLQWLVADRARLAGDPAWRPVVARTCALLGCTLPAWHEPAAFTLLERDVRPHPVTPGALRVTASFRNDAAWPQAWPEVVLTLSDIDGRPLGVRAFTAKEYLGDAPPSALVASGQGGVIRMDVLEPAPGVVGFAFDFR